METNTPKEKCVCAGKLKDPKTVHTKENCYVIPHQPDIMEEKTIEQFVDNLVNESSELLPNYKIYKGINKDSYLGWLRRQVYIELLQRIKAEKALSRAEGWKDAIKAIRYLVNKR